MKKYPETVSKNVSFGIELPNGATIKSAKVYATLGSPLFGADTSKINGVSVGTGGTVSVDVDISDGSTSVNVPFVFLCNKPSHQHERKWIPDQVITVGDQYQYNYYFEHESSLEYTDVYLLIDYTPAIEFAGWTDDPLTVGETYVKAVHMTELQQWTAVLSENANNGTPTFTPAVPGETSLALWLSQVQEIRAVLDVVIPTHDAWIAVTENRPRADVIEQIRAVIVSAM